MKPDVLLTHFDRISDAPDAIPRLRRFILDLAVRGKLVGQNRKDEAASEYLKRIQDEKMRRIRMMAHWVGRAQLPIGSRRSIAVPTNWSWTRIGICSLATDYGTSVKSDHLQNGVPVLTMGNIQGGKVVLDEQKRFPQRSRICRASFSAGLTSFITARTAQSL